MFVQLMTKFDSDPITDFFNHDWAAVGGWSLFIGLGLFNILCYFRGTVVPGWMYRQVSKTLEQAMEQNRTLLAAAEITKHFFETTAKKPAPRKRKVSEVKPHVQTEGEGPEAEAQRDSKVGV